MFGFLLNFPCLNVPETYYLSKHKPIKTPEDGFEPPLEEPESSVLPLDDSGLQNNYTICYTHFSNKNQSFVEFKKTFLKR